MAKPSADTKVPHERNDLLGFTLIVLVALPLLCAQITFDRNDVSFLTTHLNNPKQNWMGVVGAWSAYGTFVFFGGAAYLLPLFAGIFGISYLLNFFRYLRERLIWHLFWVLILLMCVAGLLFIADDGGHHGRFHFAKGITSAGGFLGYLSYGQTQNWEFGFCLLGQGATIIYAALGLISLLFLTNFHLSHWIRSALPQRTETAEDALKSQEEIALEKRARELEKQKRKLEDEVGRSLKPEKTASGLGADLQPVPEPTVRDLSVPQAKGPRVRKTTLPEQAKTPAPVEPAPAEEVEVIPAKEVAAATTEQILGRKSETTPPQPKPVEPEEMPETEPEVTEKAEAEKVEPAKAAEPKPEPIVTIADGSAPPPAKPKITPKKHKPMTVASVPMIGNYQVPSFDFLQHPDLTVKPTESKEELMANARLMQQTLAQFDIEVSLGDITKGPTI
ncbi:MAG TPA: DNA translocase FtsK 4TM domain-containing protein, partial [Verrucomicrobiae bacterium]